MIKQINLSDCALAAPLFNAYRQFYGKASDEAGCLSFLQSRLSEGSSFVFLSLDAQGAALGFMQLYPIFSSTSLVKKLILNDLFVAPSARGQGLATALLNTAKDFAKANGYAKLALETAHTNTTAQRVYEANGWQRDTEYRTYTFLVE